ncbi:MAG: hypothetical protein ACLFQH_01020 [Halothiobacillaceae bacterium]
MAESINNAALGNPMASMGGARQADDVLNQRSAPAAQASSAQENNSTRTTPTEYVASPEVVQQAVESRQQDDSGSGGSGGSGGSVGTLLNTMA